MVKVVFILIGTHVNFAASYDQAYGELERSCLNTSVKFVSHIPNLKPIMW